MIVCTKTVDSLARRAFNKNDVAISSADAMISQFALDPTITAPAKDVFIIADTDIKNSKMLQRFKTAAVTKHPQVKIVFLVRGSRSEVTEGNGIDKVLVRPRAEQLADIVYSIVDSVESKAPVVSSAMEAPEIIQAFTPPEFEEPEQEEAEYTYQPEEHDDTSKQVELEFEPVEEEEPEEAEASVDSELVQQIRQCRKVADVSVITRELTSSKVIKDLIKDNQQYVSIEEKLRGIQEKIFNVFTDSSIKSTTDKLDRVKALLYDKEYYQAKNNTAIEQRVEEIISVVIEQVKTLLNERLSQIDKAILSINSSPNKLDYTRLAGITEERSNIILELALLDKQVREIFFNVDELANTVAGEVAENATNLTGSPLADAKLRINGESIVSDKSMETIINILATCDRTTDEFKNALRDLSVMTKKLNKLLDLDKETIAAYRQIIEFLKANKVEDTIIAETLIKKSLRMFVAKEGSGRTVVPYVLSKMKSRENANVLYVDLTGTSKLEDYGETPISIDEWVNGRVEKDFCAVVGEISESPESIQRLLVALTRAADYYRVINVVISPDQEEILNVIAPDVLVVNYIVDAGRSTLDFFNPFIESTKFENVAQRVIVNKCDVPLRPIIERLGLIDNMDCHIARIPYIPEIVDCSLHTVNPSHVESIKEGFREVSKVC